MQRHESLRPLSRDHHLALRYANRLVALADAEGHGLARHWSDIRLRFARYWSEALAPHFGEEEDALPWEYLDPDWRERLLDDHHRIGTLFRHLMASAVADTGVLRELGRRLGAHARWEEQELFRVFQERVPAGALARVAAKLAHGHERLTDLGWLPPRLTPN